MTYHFRMAKQTDAFFCRKTGFGLNCYQTNGKARALSADIKSALRSGRLIDVIGNALDEIKKEEENKGMAKVPEEPKQTHAPVAPAAPSPEEEKEETLEEPVVVEPEQIEAVDLSKMTKAQLLSHIKENGWHLNVSNKTSVAKIIEAIDKHLKSEIN